MNPCRATAKEYPLTVSQQVIPRDVERQAEFAAVLEVLYSKIGPLVSLGTAPKVQSHLVLSPSEMIVYGGFVQPGADRLNSAS